MLVPLRLRWYMRTRCLPAAVHAPSRAMNFRILTRGLVLIALLVLLGYAVEATQVLSRFNESWVDTQVRGQGIHGELLFIAVGALFAAVGMPRQLVCFLGGYGFGLGAGMVLSLLASVLGCALAFYFARWFGRRLITRRFRERIRKLEDFLHDNTFAMTILARLLPVGSNLVNNLIAGVARVRALPFLSGSALGYVPQTLVFVLVGSGIHLNPVWRISLAVALFIVSGLMGVTLYQRYRNGKMIDAEVERQLDMPTEQR
ncbi:MAG: TVP38/TMEM64 family protein [Gammaproteobacteria bacterium]